MPTAKIDHSSPLPWRRETPTLTATPRLVHGLTLCGLGAGGGGTLEGFVPLAAALAVLTASVAWMFHRWGAPREVAVPALEAGPAGSPRTFEAPAPAL